MTAIKINREVLLIAIDRHCTVPRCNARNSIPLTKLDAHNYRGFECLQCKAWNEDTLSEQDIPEWWFELNPPDLFRKYSSA
ncbi:MAG TPA: hypothetical protein VIV66_12675, partial [Pyrinomonadaceae bacterium]